MAARLNTLDRALTRQALARQALNIKTSRDRNTTAQLTALADENHMSIATLYRLVDAYQRGGLDGLMRKKIHQPPRSTDPVVIDYVRQVIIANPTAKGAGIINNIEITARNNGWKIGSHASLYRLLNRLRQELNLQIYNQPSCNRDKIHHYVDQLPPEKLNKVESYLEYLINQGTGDRPEILTGSQPGILSQPTLDL